MFIEYYEMKRLENALSKFTFTIAKIAILYPCMVRPFELLTTLISNS
jgi:hypothetical protein